MRISAVSEGKMSFDYTCRRTHLIHLSVPLLLIFLMNGCESFDSTVTNSDYILVNTTEAFFLSLKTSEYFPSGQVTTWSESSGRKEDLPSNGSSSSVVNSKSVSPSKDNGEAVELLMSVAGRADLPEWMYYKFDRDTSTGYLYGSPVTDGEIDLEIIALNTRTYDTTMDTMKLTIVEREKKALFEVEMKLINYDVLDLFKGSHLEDLLSIYKNYLWKDSSDVYVTRIVSPSDVGGRLPVDPKDKEGVIVRIGSPSQFSPALLDLEREVNVLKNRNPCPKRYKQTSKENLFLRTVKHEFFNDWCSFTLIREESQLSHNVWRTNESLESDTLLIEDDLDDTLSPQIITLLEGQSFKSTKRDLQHDTSYLKLMYLFGTVYFLLVPLIIVSIVFIIGTCYIFYPTVKKMMVKSARAVSRGKRVKRANRMSLSFICQSNDDDYRAQINTYFGDTVEPIVGYPPSPYAYLSSLKNRSFLPNNPLRFDTIRRVQFQLDPLIYSTYPQGHSSVISSPHLMDDAIHMNPLVSFDTAHYDETERARRHFIAATAAGAHSITINNAMDGITLSTIPSLVTSSTNHLQMTTQGLECNDTNQFTLKIDPNLPPPPPFTRSPFKSPPPVSTL